MTIEAATWVSQLDPTYPEGGSAFKEIDNHARLMKACLVATWPNLFGPVNMTAAQLNAAARAILTADGTGFTVPAAGVRAGKLFAFDGSGNADVTMSYADLQFAIALALASANFKGEWSSLTGPLNTPASVKHNDRGWMLLNNLADVTLSEPGVSADWTAGDFGSPVQVITASGGIVAGIIYSVVTPGVTVTLPLAINRGETFTVRNTTTSEIYVNWNGNTLKGQVPQSPMRIPRLRGFSVIHNGSTLA